MNKTKKSYPTKRIWELSRFIIKRRESINLMNNMDKEYDLDKIEISAKKYFNKYYSLYAFGKSEQEGPIRLLAKGK